MSEFKDFYEAGYSLADPAEAERMGRWRALGAESKSGHAVALLARAGLEPESLVEIGCGDGALLAALAERGVAERYAGFELSGPAAEIARGRGVGPVEVFDGEHVPAGDDAFDLAILSHVLEHVPAPGPLLAEAARVAPHVLVEVPLEANRSARRPAKRAEAARIGHIQAFSRRDIHAIAGHVGLQVLDELTDPLPLRHHAFFGDRRRAAAKWAVRAGAHRAAPRAAERLFTVHHAALLARIS